MKFSEDDEWFKPPSDHSWLILSILGGGLVLGVIVFSLWYW